MIPYGRQSIDEDDIQAVVEVLRSDWLTTGPMVEKFELAVAEYVGIKFAVAVSSGTAALHATIYALGVGSNDEVILSPMTFAATANCIVYQGGTPVFADVDPDTLLIDPAKIEEKITGRTKAIIAVDFAGQPCDYDGIRKITDKHRLALLADSCHALGAEYKGKKTGSLADMTVFSFHPVKHITTGEGGMVVTDDETFMEKMKSFRNHGITSDFRKREEHSTWHYEMKDLGYNYRITDIQCALGVSQLKKLPAFLARRREIAEIYDEAFANSEEIIPLAVRDGVLHAYHLYVIRIKGSERSKVFTVLREKGIGVNVHYIPVHLHPFYNKRFGSGPDLCPVAEKSYKDIISLPMFPIMSDVDIDRVINAVKKAVSIQDVFKCERKK